MKYYLAIAAVALAVPALAQSTWQPGEKTKPGTQPTGYQIRGCADHEMIGSTSHQTCNVRAVTTSKVTGQPIIFDRQDKGGADAAPAQ